MGRILGIDFGHVRVGLALSDPLQTVATGHRTVEFRGRKQVLNEIEAVCREQGVDFMVIGYPLHLDGRVSELAKDVDTFVAHLEKRMDLEVVKWDERLTSVQAEQAMTQTGTRRDKRRSVVDQIAAQIMLQSYLDATADDEAGGGMDMDFPEG